MYIFIDFNLFAANVALIDKPGSWILPVKFVKTPVEEWNFL